MKETIEGLNKIFNCLNTEYFNEELTLPLFEIKKLREPWGKIEKQFVIKNKGDFSIVYKLPLSILQESIINVSLCVFHNMIHQYDFMNDNNMSSRADEYHNRRFKDFAESCGLDTFYTSKNGYIIKSTKAFEDVIKKNNLVINCKKLYYEKKDTGTCRNNRYVDDNPNHSPVWIPTKDRIIFCLDGMEDIANEIEKKYGIKRMYVSDK